MAGDTRLGTFINCFLIMTLLTLILLASMFATVLQYKPRYIYKETSGVKPRQTHVRTITAHERRIRRLQSIRRKALDIPTCPQVLIFTHPRSGSTLTGHIIQQVHDSFYAFEPLRYLAESLEKGERVTYLNKTERSYQSNDTIWVKAEILYRWFTCDFERVNMKDLSSMFIGAYSTNLEEYATCLRVIRNPTKSIPGCFPLLKGQCKRAKVRLIKTVRLDIESVEILLQLMPNLRVIYLVRDPRGKLSSQMSLRPADWEIVTFLAKDLCVLLNKEIEVVLELRDTYPERLKVLIYERLAFDPVEFARRLFAFMDLSFTTELKLVVKSLTMTKGENSACYWCAKRTDSYLTANKWRQRVLFKHTKKVDTVCSAVYKHFGYRVLPDESILRNLSYPLFVETNITSSFL
ncbi:carbohydrate sulfotransferase 6-like isoform X2 [Argopecten irradians]|uniref:carbohydrate sulfotransferase 6-like isoform X2 n=1 Tax=Argopecten irradians TaxID=31199 RepID=UPI003719FFA0